MISGASTPAYAGIVARLDQMGGRGVGSGRNSHSSYYGGGGHEGRGSRRGRGCHGGQSRET